MLKRHQLRTKGLLYTQALHDGFSNYRSLDDRWARILSQIEHLGALLHIFATVFVESPSKISKEMVTFTMCFNSGQNGTNKKKRLKNKKLQLRTQKAGSVQTKLTKLTWKGGWPMRNPRHHIERIAVGRPWPLPLHLAPVFPSPVGIVNIHQEWTIKTHIYIYVCITGINLWGYIHI